MTARWLAPTADARSATDNPAATIASFSFVGFSFILCSLLQSCGQDPMGKMEKGGGKMEIARGEMFRCAF